MASVNASKDSIVYMELALDALNSRTGTEPTASTLRATPASGAWGSHSLSKLSLGANAKPGI